MRVAFAQAAAGTPLYVFYVGSVSSNLLMERNDIANLGLACTQKTASKTSWGGEYAKNICTIDG